MTASSSGDEEELLRLSVKELKQRITEAGGLVPVGHLEKSDLVAALQEALQNGSAKRASVDANLPSGSPVSTAPPVASHQVPGATKDTETDRKGQEELSKLSVGEIKRRLRWAGAAVPAGHLEKAELVSALQVALEAKASADRAREQQEKAKAAAPPKTSSSMPRPAVRSSAPVAKDTAAIKEQQNTTKWFVMPEEDLKCRILDAGGKVPDGNVGRHYLVQVLKNALRAKEKAAAKPAEPEPKETPISEPVTQTDKVIEEVAAMAGEAAPPAAASATPAEVAPSVSQPPPPPREWDPDEDVSKLSAGELKRRIREYDEALLVGLAEKAELVAALQKAISVGPPPVRASVSGTATTAPATGTGVELDEAAMQAQMEEMQNLLASAAETDGGSTPLEAAKLPGATAPSSAESSPATVRPTQAGGSHAAPPLIEVAVEKPCSGASKAPASAVVASSSAVSSSVARAAKRRREVTISDDEDKPKSRRAKADVQTSRTSATVDISCDGSAPAVAIDDDEDCVQAVDAAKSAAAPAQPADKVQAASKEPEEQDGTWI